MWCFWNDLNNYMIKPPDYDQYANFANSNPSPIIMKLFFIKNDVVLIDITRVDKIDSSGNNLSGVAVQFATQFWANATQ